MISSTLRVLMLSLFLTSLSLAATDEPAIQKIYGYREYATLLPEGITLKALMDTGALTASINAINIEEYQKEGQTWVKFDVPLDADRSMHFDKTLKRYASIKLKAEVGNSEKPGFINRPVVMMTICINNQIQEVEVNLTSRENFLNPLLLGRDALIAFNALIDPRLTFTAPKTCRK